MRHSVRALLGLAATTAVLAVGVPAMSSAANAATASATTTASAAYYDYDEFWGPYYSKYFDDARAKAKGRVFEDGNYVHVTGKVYDRHSPYRLGGYVQVKFENEDGDEYYYSAVKYGDHGYKWFHFHKDDVDNVQVRVCYYDRFQNKKKLCGKWYYIYEADGGDSEE